MLAKANVKAREIIKEAEIQKEKILKEPALLRAIKLKADEIKYPTQKECEKKSEKFIFNNYF